jgi:hypothetical protein
MLSDRQKALPYIVGVLLFILAGSFWLGSNGMEVPEFFRVIAVSLAISNAALLT